VGRGTSERPVSGDRGALLSLELSTPAIAQTTRIFGFVDAGALSNVVSNGTTKLSSDRLASVGLGLRYASQIGLQGSIEYGRIVTGSRVPLTVNSSSPQSGDEKIHLSLGYRF
jgi:hemolysin activation/secretion protein